MKQTTYQCILCKKTISSKTKPEHVLLNALGGRMTVSKVLCPDCNHAMGIGPDKDLAESTKYIRNICNMPCGDGDSAPEIRGHPNQDNLNINLKPGMQIDAHSRNALEVNFDVDEIAITIRAYSEKESEKLCEAAAHIIAKNFGTKHPKVVEAIKDDILKDQLFSYSPAPAIGIGIEFGKGEAVRSKLKACLVLLADLMGNVHVLECQYDPIRAFINEGNSSGYQSSDFMVLDSRDFPEPLPSKYSSHPNIIWVGCENNQKVYGYFRLYGTLGWRVLLGESKNIINRMSCLISNPFDPKQWGKLRGEAALLRYDWVGAQLTTEDLCFDKVSRKIDDLVKYGMKLSYEIWLENLVKEGIQKLGCKEGEIFTEEHLDAFTKYLSAPLTAMITKQNIPKL